MSSPLGDEVPAGGPPRGARANAVPAPAAWASLTEVDRRVAQPLLDSLEDAGVAAYAEPLVAPGDATERLYVDAAQRDVAEAVVAAELPGLLAELGPAAELDPFDAIVAGWDAVPEAATWPAEEDVRPARREPDIGPPRSAPAARPSRRPEEDHFIPPPPPPAPPAQPVTRYAVLAVCLGLFVLIGLPLLGTAPSHVASVLGAVSLLAGLGTLVWRMRDAPSVDDGPDDGAVL